MVDDASSRVSAAMRAYWDRPAPRRRFRPTKFPPLRVVESAWDPEPVEFYIEAERARALLLEVIRRASHDWVLYRTSKRLTQKEVAQSAFIWLFEEKPGHPWYRERDADEREITSFLGICSLLDLDPDYVRKRVKQLTPQQIKTAGRPAERRYKKNGCETVHYQEYSVVDTISLDELEESYEK